MVFPVAVLAVSLQILVADRGGVPSLNMKPTCESPMRAELGATTDGKVCLDNENKARSELLTRWSQFAASDRTRCSGLVRMGGPPSYIELLTCLEMSQQGRSLEAKAPPQDTLRGTAHHSPKR